MRAPLLRVPAHKLFDAQGNALALAGKAHSGAMPPLQRFAERVPCELQDAHASAGSLVLDIFVERGVPVRLSGCLSKSQLQPYLRPLGISGECLRIPRCPVGISPPATLPTGLASYKHTGTSLQF